MMEYYSVVKRNGLLIYQQYMDALKIIMLSEEVRQTRVRTKLFHLYKILGNAK